jgi:hypothetical protein
MIHGRPLQSDTAGALIVFTPDIGTQYFRDVGASPIVGSSFASLLTGPLLQWLFAIHAAQSVSLRVT